MDETTTPETDELKTSRRSLLKGAGVAAGGLAALGALGAAAVQGAGPAGATPGPDVPYPGAPSLALFLDANGTQINGDNTQAGQEGSITCVYYELKGAQAVSAATGNATGRRHYQPIVIRKFVDRATPRIHQALSQGQVIDATFKFYRPNADGFPENFYNVTIKHGRIVSIDEYSPDNQATAGQQGGGHPMEEVSMTFSSITWQFGESSFTDNVSAKV
jgi:type VI secretion system secreted protein Hcp